MNYLTKVEPRMSLEQMVTMKNRLDNQTLVDCYGLMWKMRLHEDLSSFLDLGFGLFESLGYPEEPTVDWHGGPSGCYPIYFERCQDPEEVVKPDMALTWYMPVAVARSEELMLVDEHGASLTPVAPGWPMLEIEYGGSQGAIRNTLVR